MTALGCIAKHSTELAESVIEAKIFSAEVLYHTQHPNDNVVKAAATLIKEVCKHTVEVSLRFENLSISVLAAVYHAYNISRAARVQ